MPLLAGGWSIPSSSHSRRLTVSWEGKASLWDPGAKREEGRLAALCCLGSSCTVWPGFRGLYGTLSFLPLDCLSGSRGPTQKPRSLGAAFEEAQRRHLLVAHPPPRNLSQHLPRQDLASRRPGWEPPWEAPRPGPAPLSKWLHLSVPQCSSSGEWVSKYPSV